MFSTRSFLLCAFATLIGASIAMPSVRRDEGGEQYSCRNNAVTTDKLEPNPFYMKYCLKGLCVDTGDAVLTHVDSIGCDVYSNVCSDIRNQVKIGDDTYISTGYGQCAPVQNRNSILTFTCPNGDELLWNIEEDNSSYFTPGKVVKQEPLAYFDSSRKDHCVEPNIKGKSDEAVDYLRILCDSDNTRLCVD